MKHLLILIVAAALYLHFYPNEEVTALYNDGKQVLLEGFSEFSDTKVRLKADKVYTDLESELGSFSEKEIERLKVITSSRHVVKEYYFSICKTEQRDIVFHITNQKKVCGVISRYANLL
ncbi:hypothetical protein [Colwellia piezophila]|uniref:hypothetical protein n=1 Tax=Colwellia piezophila TaxID=211668 RepID=UPI00037BFC2D|nr:hypothetical protein [Colwellia piezophila]